MVFVSQEEGAKIMGIDSGGGDGKSRFEKGIENRGKKRPNRQETIVKMQVSKRNSLQERIEDEHWISKKSKRGKNEKEGEGK